MDTSMGNPSSSAAFFMEKSQHFLNTKPLPNVHIAAQNEKSQSDTNSALKSLLMSLDDFPIGMPIRLYFSDFTKKDEFQQVNTQPTNLPCNISGYEPGRSEHKTSKKLKLAKGKSHSVARDLQAHVPFGSSSSPHLKNIIELQNVEDFQRFNVFVPLFNKIDKKTFTDILIKFLCDYSHHISLVDFYKLLYISSDTTDATKTGMKGNFAIYNDTPGPKRDALLLCRLIIETFKSSCVFCANESGQYIKIIQLPLLNMHETLRIFLSIKIVLDTVKIVDENLHPNCSLSRSLIHKTYYILCKKLIKRNPISSNFSELQNNVALNQSQFGKVMRSIFPDIKAKRVGKRGYSRYHYQGVVWKNESIDDDTRNLAKLSLDDIDKYIDSNEDKTFMKRKTTHASFLLLDELDAVAFCAVQTNVPKTKLLTTRPLHSFVDISHTFASPDFSLRVWAYTPGEIPQQSQWSRNAMYKSVNLLKSHNLDVEPLLFNVQNQLFSEISVHWFLQEISVMIFSLMDAGNDAYLHLYLIVSLFLFPICFASETERIFISRDQLSHSLTTFVKGIETNYRKYPPHIQSHSMAFAKIIRKLINSIKLFSSRVPTSLARRVSEVVADYSGHETNATLMKEMQERTNKIVQSAIVTACNALNWEFLGHSSASDPRYQAKFIRDITMRYSYFCAELDALPSIPAPLRHGEFSESTYELPFHLFLESTWVFHAVFLSDPLILKLPVKLIELLVNKVVNEFQTRTFHRLGNMDTELSKEVYKTWWVFSTVLQEHMSIISEVIALSQSVAKQDIRSPL